MKQVFQLKADYTPLGDQPAAIQQLVQGLRDGLSHLTLLGVTGSGKTFTIANVINEVQRPTIILAPNKTLAAQLYGEMKEFFPDAAVEYFVSYFDYYQPEAYVPTTDTFIEKDSSVNDHIEQMRLSATKALFERPDVIIVGTVSAIYGLGNPRKYMKMVIHLDRGDKMDQRTLLRRLAELQYVRNDYELRRSSFRVRGDLIDVHPAESDYEAVRIELFDDEIEKLSYFDPLTGEVIRSVPRLTIYPKSHYVMPRDTILYAMKQIRLELKEHLAWLRKENKLLEAQRLEQRTMFDLEMINELGYCSGIENYSRYLSGREAGQPPHCLLDYLPENALMVMDESHVAVPQFGGMYRGDHARKTTLVEHGFRLPSALDNRPLMFEEFEQLSPQTIFVSATPGKYEQAHSGVVADQVVRPTGLLDPPVEVRPASSQVDDVLSEIYQRAEKKERVLITTLTKRMAEDLTDYLLEHDVRARYLHSNIDTVERTEIIRDLRMGVFDVLIGINLLREGLDIPEVSLVAVFDADKEGFLRSETSLIQTMGRAARHLHGQAILYADETTQSMRKAMQEAERRRKKQTAYNRAHKITPKGIQKKVPDIMEGAYAYTSTNSRKKKKRASQVTEKKMKRAIPLAPAEALKQVRKLEEKMHRHASNLEFEEAAVLRDQVREIKEHAFISE